MRIIFSLILILIIINLYSAYRDGKIFAIYGMEVVNKEEDINSFRAVVVGYIFALIMGVFALIYNLLGLNQ